MDDKLKYVSKLAKGLSLEQQGELYLQLTKSLVDSPELLEQAEEQVIASIPFGTEEYRTKAQELIDEPDKIYGLATGYSNLDQITRGMDAGELIIFGAETGIGKSMLAQNILHNLADRGIGSLFISLEMSNQEALKRYIQMDMDAHPGEDNLKRVMEMPLYAMPHDLNPTLENLDKLIGEAVTEHGAKIILVDHIHYFARSVDNASGEIGLIVRRLKDFARKYEVPVMAISHLKKLTKPGTMPTSNDLRDSSFIAQDADIVCMLSRDIFAEDKLKRRILNFRVIKNRPRGEVGDGQFNISMHYKLKEAI